MTITNKLLRRQILDAVRAAPPVEPRCPHALECGGCAFQDRPYPAQVAAKRDALRQLWQGRAPAALLDALEVVPSPDPFGYRTRMDYVATKGRFGLRRGGSFNYIVELHECHLIPPAAFAPARSVYERAVALGLPDYNLRSHTGFLRYLVVRRSPQERLLLALVSAAPRDAADDAALEQLAAHALAQPGVVGFHWLINDSRTDISFGAPRRHWGEPTLAMMVGERTLWIGPNTFFQNNVHLLRPLLDDVARQVGPTGAVADLYGGVGTIALHLAGQVGQLVCVEEVAESAGLALANIAANGVANVRAVQSDVLPFLRDQPAGGFEVVVADPPRTGLGPHVSAELLRLRPGRLVYVSCNPLTLLEDAETLLRGYRLSALRGYDMFPHTPHMEALAVFDAAEA